jgi:hypothetical protein
MSINVVKIAIVVIARLEFMAIPHWAVCGVATEIAGFLSAPGFG